MGIKQEGWRLFWFVRLHAGTLLGNLFIPEKKTTSLGERHRKEGKANDAKMSFLSCLLLQA